MSFHRGFSKIFPVICGEAGLIGTYLLTLQTDTEDFNLDHLVKYATGFLYFIIPFSLATTNKKIKIYSLGLTFVDSGTCQFLPRSLQKGFSPASTLSILTSWHLATHWKQVLSLLLFSLTWMCSVLPIFSMVFVSLLFVIIFGAQTVLDLASRNPFKLVLNSVTSFHFSPSFLLFFLSTRCSKLILYLPCPSPGISHFSEEHWYAHCYWGVFTSRPSLQTELGHTYMYT